MNLQQFKNRTVFDADNVYRWFEEQLQAQKEAEEAGEVSDDILERLVLHSNK